jgi:large subunit ribosomal protein L15
MFTLNNLTALVKKRKRVGRGGSRGGTSGKGHKGQKARSGGSVHPRFEGGQMPLYRRLPKRGFNNEKFAKDVVAVNIAMLDIFTDGQEVTKELLLETGIIKSRRSKGPFDLKFIGSTPLEKKFVVRAELFSKGAQEAILNAGGNAVVVAKES